MVDQVTHQQPLPPLQSLPQQPNNSMAKVSIGTGLGGWGLWLLTFVFSWIPILNICIAPLGCLSPIGWIVGIVTGHMGIRQIKTSGEGGRGMAVTGLISGYIGIGIVLITFCLFTVAIALTAAGLLTIPFLEELLQEY
jgi:hypothetical protein